MRKTQGVIKRDGEPSFISSINRPDTRYPVWYRNKKEYVTQNACYLVHNCALRWQALMGKVTKCFSSGKHVFSQPWRSAAGRTPLRHDGHPSVNESQLKYCFRSQTRSWWHGWQHSFYSVASVILIQFMGKSIDPMKTSSLGSSSWPPQFAPVGFVIVPTE